MEHTTNDVALLEAWRAGDAAAGDRLLGRHYASVLRFFELKVATAAPDLTQRTFLACVEGRQRFRGDSTFKGYLFGVARHLLYAHIREMQRDPGLQSWSESDGGRTQTSMSTVVAREQEHLLLLRALASLDMDLQIALGLHYFEGLKAREIGETLQISTSTVTSRLARGRDLLRQHVGQEQNLGRAQQTLLADLDGWAAKMVLVPGVVVPRTIRRRES